MTEKQQTLLDVIAIGRKNLDPMIVGTVRMIDSLDALSEIISSSDLSTIESIDDFFELPKIKTWKNETIGQLPTETSALFIGLLTWSLAPVFTDKK